MTPTAAGWAIAGTDAPPLCPGSGQLLAGIIATRLTSCPVCGRFVAVDALALSDHIRPETEPEAPSFGL